MFKNLGLIGLLWLTARFVYGVDFALAADGLGLLIADHGFATLIYAGTGALALPCISLLFRGLGCYSAMFLLDKFFFWCGQLLVSLVAFAAVIFWFEAGVNLWTLLGPLALVPFLVMASAAFCLKLFDFNYPLKETLVSSLGLPIVSFLIIWGSRFYSTL